MKKNVIKLTESELEGLVKKIMSEEKKTPTIKKHTSTKSLNEGKELILRFQKEKKRLVKEGYTKREITEQLGDFLSFSDDSPLNQIGFGSAKQWMISWILGQLNVSGELNKLLSIALSKAHPKDYSKIFDPVDNCDFIADLLFDTFSQYMLQKMIMSVGAKASGGQTSSIGGFASSDLFSLVAGNAIMGLTKNSEFKKSLQKVFEKALCQALRGEGGEAELSTELESSEIPDVLVRDIKRKL